ncbi:MAG: hypothetical protein K1X94_33745 [Sandaracinaceae bacterium]|nr:hypothetical protein [Sandaracinaceae bacterium]
MSEKKRVSLPVVGQPRAVAGVDVGEGVPTARAPLAWVFLGALAVLAIMLPLMYLGVALVGAIYRAPVGGPKTVAAAGVVAALVVACSAFGGGYLVGRFGGRAGPREGAAAGLLAGLALWAMTRMPIGVILIVLTTPLAWVGARLGRRTREPGDSIGA